ncbi:phospholipase A2-like isoform X2 [Centruroides sculpturatus]|nr:phospholipase A2-like isoform X2 [Centruroides sculpturatus]
MILLLLLCQTTHFVVVLPSEIFYKHDWSKITVEFPPNPCEESGLKCSENRSWKFSNSISNKQNDITRKHLRHIPYENIKKRYKRSQDDFIKTFAILPGTKWCGAGNKSDGGDLGYFNDTDRCCRRHDSCPDSIKSKATKYGLRNNESTTMSHCDCDDEFYYCLKEVNSVVSNKVGIMFFNVLQKRCFRKDYPIVECKNKSWFARRCKEYEFDRSKRKIWQIFDAKEY